MAVGCVAVKLPGDTTVARPAQYGRIAILGLMTMSIFLLPRILKRPPSDPVGGRVALRRLIAVGISCSYVVYFGVGLLESIAIHQGVEISKAPDAVRGAVGAVCPLCWRSGYPGAWLHHALPPISPG
jgi:hypothetical protein